MIDAYETRARTCMYVCMYACMYVCMHACMYVHVRCDVHNVTDVLIAAREDEGAG